MKKHKAVNKSGFTLIEILIVVLIIGLLASIALPGYRKAVEKSKASEALSNLSALSKSEHSFYLAKNKYTDKFSDLDIQLQGTMDEEVLKTEYFDYELLSTGILASRNNKEYSIYRDYETSQIMCTPSSHFICDDLGEFTKEPCEKVGMAWANTNSTCYADEEDRCLGLYADELGAGIWKGTYCGYNNTGGKTIDEGMKCYSTSYGCSDSIVNSGGICSGGIEACKYSTINAGGICEGDRSCERTFINGGECKATTNGGCYMSTVTAGGICSGHCNTATIKDGGICSGVCIGAIVNEGGICSGECGGAKINNGGKCTGECGQAVVNEGGECSGTCLRANINNGGVCSGVCSAAKINNGAKCLSSETNKCGSSWIGDSALYYGTGCCEGNYCGPAPKCNCPIDENTGKHKTSC